MTSPHEDAPRDTGWAAPGSGGSAPEPATAPATPGAQGWGPVPGYPPAAGAPAGPPGAPVPPGGHPVPGYGPAGYGYGQPGAYGGPGYGGPGYGAPGYGPPLRPPAAQPGIVPLRPLGLGEVLDGSFRAIRANPRVMFGLALAVVGVVVAIQAVVTWYVGGLLAGAVADLGESMDPDGMLGLADQMGTVVAQYLTLPFLALATTVLTGLLIVSVSRSVIGQTISLGEVARAARRRVWWVVGFSVLLGVASTLVTAAWVGGVFALAMNEVWWAVATLGLVGGALLFVAAFWVSVRTMLVPAALMLEGGRFWATVARAWRLTRGSFWRLLGTYLLVQIIVGVVVSAVTYPATMITSLLLDDPFGQSFGGIVILSVANVIALTLTTVFSAAVIALLYIDVRMRREGLDVELARAADETA